MAKERSYLEFKDFPLNSLQAPVSLSSVLGVTKYGEISEADKKDVIVLKETFVLYDKRNSKLGVFTRSENDHGTKIGQCSTLLSSNFDRGECTITQDGTIIYDVKDRLHNYLREISGLFHERRQKQIPTIFFHDKKKGKRYLFLTFVLECDSHELPLCYKLDNRQGDMFIGMRDISEVNTAIARYNKSSFEVDKFVVQNLKRRLFPKLFGGITLENVNLIKIEVGDFSLAKFSLVG